jgi:3-polyprenyl-4-hydroxybenzoate decarboxylase
MPCFGVLLMTDVNHSKTKPLVTGPFDSLRDYMAAIEDLGQVLHVSGLDQDSYEATGFMYRLIDKLGWAEAPAVVFRNIKINGQWHEGPIIANQYGRWESEGLAFGVDSTSEEQYITYQNLKV